VQGKQTKPKKSRAMVSQHQQQACYSQANSSTSSLGASAAESPRRGSYSRTFPPHFGYPPERRFQLYSSSPSPHHHHHHHHHQVAAAAVHHTHDPRAVTMTDQQIDSDSTPQRKRIAVAVSAFFSPFFRLLLNYSFSSFLSDPFFLSFICHLS